METMQDAGPDDADDPGALEATVDWSTARVVEDRGPVEIVLEPETPTAEELERVVASITAASPVDAAQSADYRRELLERVDRARDVLARAVAHDAGS